NALPTFPRDALAFLFAHSFLVHQQPAYVFFRFLQGQRGLLVGGNLPAGASVAAELSAAIPERFGIGAKPALAAVREINAIFEIRYRLPRRDLPAMRIPFGLGQVDGWEVPHALAEHVLAPRPFLGDAHDEAVFSIGFPIPVGRNM